MKEQLISFETAKLAKKKGFYEYTSKYYYNPKGEIFYQAVNYKNWTKAPTQSLLQKWLREKYKIFVDCSHSRINDDGEVTLYQTQITSVSIGESYNFKHHIESNDCYGETYEEALEKGLQEALKLIK